MVEVVKDIDKGYSFRDGKARAVKLDRYDLVEQIRSLLRVFAYERGESHRFREEIRSLLRHVL